MFSLVISGNMVTQVIFTDKMIRHRACAMRDLAHAIVDSDLEPQFEKQCLEIVESRNRRGVKLDKFAPRYQRVLPKNLMIDPSTGDAIPKPDSPADVQKPKTREPRLTIRESTPRKRRSKRSSWARGVIKSNRKKKLDAQFEISSNNESCIMENSESVPSGDNHVVNDQEQSTSDGGEEIIEDGVNDDDVIETMEVESTELQKQTREQNDIDSEETSDPDKGDSNSAEELEMSELDNGDSNSAAEPIQDVSCAVVTEVAIEREVADERDLRGGKIYVIRHMTFSW